MGIKVIADHLRMVVNSRIDAHALDSANHLGDFALVDRSQASAGRMLDLS